MNGNSPNLKGVALRGTRRGPSARSRRSQNRLRSDCSSFNLRNCCDKSSADSAHGLVSRVTPVHTALRNCTRDEGRSFEVGNQVLISSRRKLLSSKAMVVNVAEKSGHDPVRQG